ncbi:6529_t:CDS:2, partial [Gigaspora rosea]
EKWYDAIYSAQHAVIPKQHAMFIIIRKQIKNRYIRTPEYLAKQEIAIEPAVQKRIEEMKEQCGPIVWKQIGDIIVKYIDVFRRKEELRTSVNNKVIPKIKLELNKKEKDIPERDKRQQVRKYSKDELKIIKKLLDKLKENNIVKQGFSNWGSNVLVITKKDRTKKIAIDYRNLNKHLKQFKEPLPYIHQMLQKIAAHKLYTTMDLKCAYWQQKMHEDSQKYTASIFGKYGTYIWNNLPFGISTAPAYLINAINKLLSDFDWILLYMDDLTIVADNIEQMRNRLMRTLERLKKAALRLKYSKCEFCVTKTTILNHEVEYGKI